MLFKKENVELLIWWSFLWGGIYLIFMGSLECHCFVTVSKFLAKSESSEQLTYAFWILSSMTSRERIKDWWKKTSLYFNLKWQPLANLCGLRGTGFVLLFFSEFGEVSLSWLTEYWWSTSISFSPFTEFGEGALFSEEIFYIWLPKCEENFTNITKSV